MGKKIIELGTNKPLGEFDIKTKNGLRTPHLAKNVFEKRREQKEEKT